MSSIKLKYHKIVHTWARSRAGAIFQREHGPRRIQEPVFDKSAPSSHCSLLVGESEMAVPSTSWLPGQQEWRPRPHPSQTRPQAPLSVGPGPRGHLGALLGTACQGDKRCPGRVQSGELGAGGRPRASALSPWPLGQCPRDRPGEAALLASIQAAWTRLPSDTRWAHPAGTHPGRERGWGSEGSRAQWWGGRPHDAPPLHPASPLGPHVCMRISCPGSPLEETAWSGEQQSSGQSHTCARWQLCGSGLPSQTWQPGSSKPVRVGPGLGQAGSVLGHRQSQNQCSEGRDNRAE